LNSRSCFQRPGLYHTTAPQDGAALLRLWAPCYFPLVEVNVPRGKILFLLRCLDVRLLSRLTILLLVSFQLW
jgi:hypothetical protein